MKPIVINANGTRILDLIVQGQRRGVPPTIRELCQATGIRNINGVKCHLQRLQQLGLIDWDPYLQRTLRPLFVFEAIKWGNE